MSPTGYAEEQRSAALRYMEDSAPRTASNTAQQDYIEPQTPITPG
jgi:hypothetical protein